MYCNGPRLRIQGRGSEVVYMKGTCSEIGKDKSSHEFITSSSLSSSKPPITIHCY